MRRLTITMLCSLLVPGRMLLAQDLHGPESVSLLGAASEFVRATWLKSMPTTVLEVDPRQMPTGQYVLPGDLMHDAKTLSGIARKGAIAVATLDSARACAGARDPSHPCHLRGFVTFTAPEVHGDSARVLGFLRIAYPPGITRSGDPGLATGTFALTLARTGGKWRVTAKRESKPS